MALRRRLVAADRHRAYLASRCTGTSHDTAPSGSRSRRRCPRQRTSSATPRLSHGAELSDDAIRWSACAASNGLVQLRHDLHVDGVLDGTIQLIEVHLRLSSCTNAAHIAASRRHSAQRPSNELGKWPAGQWSRSSRILRSVASELRARLPRILCRRRARLDLDRVVVSVHGNAALGLRRACRRSIGAARLASRPGCRRGSGRAAVVHTAPEAERAPLPGSRWRLTARPWLRRSPSDLVRGPAVVHGQDRSPPTRSARSPFLINHRGPPWRRR